MKNFVVISAIFMMLAVQYGSCGDFLYIDFDKDNFSNRYIKVTADFDKGGDVEFNIGGLNGYNDIMMESASTFNKITWMSSGDRNEFLKLVNTENQGRKYRLNYDRVLAPVTQVSPCEKIAGSNDTLCIFRLRIDYSGSPTSRAWTPLYLRVKNYSDKPNRSLNLYGGSHRMSNGHISNYDAYMADTLAAQLNFSMENVTTANEPQRKLALNGVNERTFDLVSQIKPSYIYFQCPKFAKLVPFGEDVQQRNVTINLAHLGIPFDTNMFCSFSLFFTDIHNEMNLIQINGNGLFRVLQDPRSLDWEREERDELKREYNQLVVKYNNLLKTLQGVLDANPMRPAPRMLIARRARGLLSKIFKH